ncbi:MAG: hypothetical protein Q7R52_03420 [archaeon]|nr:hypothetical protein [archaeon]
MVQTKIRKKFFNVEIPAIERETEVQAYELSEVEGRYIKYDLTRILKGKSAELQLKVKIQDGKAIAKPRQIKLLPYFIVRMIRKGTNYVEDSFSANCKNAQLRIKPFLITRKKVSRSVRTALRNKAKEEIINYIKDKTSDEIFEDVIKNKLQKPLSLTLKKIYPLSFCDIRILKIEKEI